MTLYNETIEYNVHVVITRPVFIPTDTKAIRGGNRFSVFKYGYKHESDLRWDLVYSSTDTNMRAIRGGNRFSVFKYGYKHESDLKWDLAYSSTDTNMRAI